MDTDKSASDDWIAVGRLHRVRGRRGELLAEIYSSKPGRADQLKDVLLVKGDRRHQVQIEEVWYHSGVPVFKFQGIDSISDAEVWEGADILVPPQDRVEFEEGEYPDSGLIGCQVLEGDRLLGVVSGIEEFTGQVLLSVTAPGGGEVLIPFVKAFCREIDIAGKKIMVELPAGLIELNL